MKKLAIFFIVAAACINACKSGYDNISDYASEETVYPGKFDTIFTSIGHNRIVIDLLKAGRLPASKIVLGKAKKTIVEVAGEEHPRVWDSICSWVSIDGLDEARLYRFKVYTIDEFGNKSVPQEAAEVPFTDVDIERYDEVPEPKISPSPYSSTLSWLDISNPMMRYAGMKYRYLDQNGEERSGFVHADDEIYFHMQNLRGEADYTCDISVCVIPFRGETPIVDTIELKRSYFTRTNSEIEYQNDRKDKYRRVDNVGWTEGATIFWTAESDPTQVYTVVTYMDYSDPDNPVPAELKVLRNAQFTVLPGVKHGDPFSWYSVYTPFGSIAEVETDEQTGNTTEFDEDGLLFINRKYWWTIYTFAGGLSTDGPRIAGVEMFNAHIDESTASYLGMSKLNRETNTAQGGRDSGFIIDMKYVTLFNRLLWIHRNESSGTNFCLYFHGINVWGTNDYQGPIGKYENPTANAPLNEDPNTQWEFIKQIDLGVDRDGNPTIDGWAPMRYSPALKPTLCEWQAPMFDLGKDCRYRYIRVQCYKYNNQANNKVCVSDFRLYYHIDQ